VRATAVIEVRDGTVSRLAVPPPLTAKVLGGTTAGAGPEVWLVGAAATLLEGDHLRIELRVGAGCRLTVRTVAAQVVHPCPGGGSARFDVTATVGVGGALWWRPEPVVLCAGSRYRARAEVELGAGARCQWWDELVLGRWGEDRSAIGCRTELVVDVDGRPRVRDGLRDGPGWLGPAVLGDARYLGARWLIGEEPPAAATGPPSRGEAPWLALAGGGHVQRVLDADPLTGRARLGVDDVVG
jgi:urease accessory protein